ncbi:FHA domain-containing protein [Solirubrobacter phytolaccae]|uniref:FHA domain-containing protein n=1 Tax=Solirubrobacter phytolaccae TaxID=1404360 RepID=A0A9X3NCB0_9ACTN|nr:FHA domain-containing protein [Solirubrobacter phytolaccae]MDA0182220.1 FHA domain-containing protein [Solirubrobacter phytolaccae]
MATGDSRSGGVRLVVLDGPDSGREFPLAGAFAIAIGRAEEAGIVIDDDQVSRRHALVTVFEDGARIDDLDSTNGTWVNGARIAVPHPLLEGDELRVGGTRLRLLIA